MFWSINILNHKSRKFTGGQAGIANSVQLPAPITLMVGLNVLCKLDHSPGRAQANIKGS